VTDCPTCKRAEMRPVERLVNGVIDLLRPPAGADWTGALLRIQLAMLGGRERTWYEKHRERWEETGELAELERMNRHVEQEFANN
jgi:hypothetical protein